jgi:transglutaminase-like putative cysteine protease
MKCSVVLIPVLLVCWYPFRSSAQDPSERYTRDVTAQTFVPTVYPVDSSAGAVILFDLGVVSFNPVAGNGHSFSYVLEKHTRIRLLNKSSFGLANFSLSTYRGGANSPIIENFKGVTYNLDGGKVVTTKVDKSSIFKDQSGDLRLERVVFPNVQEGSIIEYSFRVIYPGFHYIPAWTFQGSYPELWSEYDITIPTLYDYAVRNQGYQKFVVDSVVYSDATFPINFGGFMGTWTGRTIRRIWALRDVPALGKAEIYTTTLKNHLCKIEFQLSAIHANGYDRTYRTTWAELTDELLKQEKFGVPLHDRNRWMDDGLKAVVAGAVTPQQKLQRIYTWVRDHFDCNNEEGIYFSQSLKKIWEEKKGNVADINLLLAAICRHEGMEASPVILSSRAHGYAVEDYPLLSDYNYVIVRVMLGERVWLLDASKPYVGFGMLPELCYNGWARAIDSSLGQIALFPDSVIETRVTTVDLANTDSGFAGTYRRINGVFESMNVRNRLRKTSAEEFFETMRKTMADSKQMGECGFDSLGVPEYLLGWHYAMKYDFTRGTIYFNPIFHERFNSNPFNPPERHYPVEMPFCINNNYILNMEVPKGYRVEQLPKPEKVELKDSSGLFEYLISAEENKIHFRTRLVIRKTNYGLEEYPAIRDFFSLIVSKEKEPIVLKKIGAP